MIAVRLTHGKKTLDITRYISDVKWSGAYTQAARELSFSAANNPYDDNFKRLKIENGDKVKLLNNGKVLFIGRIVTTERKGEIGTLEYKAYDHLYNLLQSTMSGRWKNKTPEYITKAVCKDFGVTTGKLAKTKTRISKYLPREKSPYTVIKNAYSKARLRTKKTYMLRMDGEKLDVVERGKMLNVVLTDKECVFESTYEEDASGVINRVKAKNDKGKVVSTTQDKKSIKKYGVKQSIINIDSGTGKSEAAAEMAGPERSASISAIGNIKCVSGYKVKIKDTAAGLVKTYLIKNDEHTFSVGIHKMKLDLFLRAVEQDAKIVVNEENVEEDEGYTKKTVNAVIYGYNATGEDARNRKLVVANNTCAAPDSVALDSKITIADTGTKYDGDTYKVTDRRQQAKFKNDKYYIGILMSKEAAKNFGEHEGKVVIARKKKSKKQQSQNTKNVAESVANPTSLAEKVADIALSYRGKVRYVFGAANAGGGVSDCSGFTMYCFSKIGKNIGRDTIAQSKAGSFVDRKALRKGDIIIFQGTWRAGPSHVGIMIDNNQFVHCSSSKKTVVTSSLTGYYIQHYHSGRRIV